MKSLVFFLGAALLFGATALGIGYWAGGTEWLLQGSVALALTLVPSAITLAWLIFAYRTDPEMRLLASLGGSGIRMVIALGGGLILTQTLRDDFRFPFWCWLLVFYLTFLAFEIFLVVWQEPKLKGSAQP